MIRYAGFMSFPLVLPLHLLRSDRSCRIDRFRNAHPAEDVFVRILYYLRVRDGITTSGAQRRNLFASSIRST